MTQPIPLGPWPLGVDNVHAPSHRVFQVPGQGQPPARLRGATDVDLDDEGWPSARAGLTIVRALAAPVGLWELGGRLFYQNGEALYEGTTRLVSGLRRRVVLASHAGLIFGTDGAQHFVLDGTTAATWGLPVPEVTVAAVPGALAAGRYLVQASFVDAAGNEGGVSPLATVDLVAGQSLLVTITLAREASLVRLYASGPDGPHTSLALEAAANQGNYLLHSVTYADALPPMTEQMRGPISNAAGLASFRAFLLCWRENFVVRSEGAEPHLFHPDNILQFPGTVTACVGLDAGLWVGTTAGLYWITGEGPEAWIPRLANPGSVLAGSLKVSGTKIPAVQGRDPVALFVASNGLLAGLPSGEALSLTENRYTFSNGSRASLAYAERDPLRQVFICVEE